MWLKTSSGRSRPGTFPLRFLGFVPYGVGKPSFRVHPAFFAQRDPGGNRIGGRGEPERSPENPGREPGAPRPIGVNAAVSAETPPWVWPGRAASGDAFPSAFPPGFAQERSSESWENERISLRYDGGRPPFRWQIADFCLPGSQKIRERYTRSLRLCFRFLRFEQVLRTQAQ